MTIEMAGMFWMAVAVYLAIGAVFALFFVWKGAAMIDASARGANLWFRVFIFPGVAGLWPLILVRMFFGFRGDGDK